MTACGLACTPCAAHSNPITAAHATAPLRPIGATYRRRARCAPVPLVDHPEGKVAVAQPAHAWISGQLARAWGNERFGTVEPLAEVCLAAEQHDVPWIEWERRPALDPRTG